MAKKSGTGKASMVGVAVTEWFCEQHGIRAPKDPKKAACPSCGKPMSRSTWTMSGA